jgi:hypothetical protein
MVSFHISFLGNLSLRCDVADAPVSIMSPCKSNVVLSDEDFDELASGDELEELDLKPDEGPFGGSIVKPRHVTTSCKSLHGEYFPLSNACVLV